MKVITPIRTSDKWGSGLYGASRGTGKHRGVDHNCAEHSIVLSDTAGIVTKLGWCYSWERYPDRKHLRYVEIKDENDYFIRYLYVKPSVKVGNLIQKDQIIGVALNIADFYPGMNNHVHQEVYYLLPNGHREYINPDSYL